MISIRGFRDGTAPGLGGAGFARSAAAGTFGGPERRFLTSAIPAAAITVGLFFTMMQLIRTDEVELVRKEARPLLAIVPQHQPTELITRELHPAPPVDVNLPPLPPVEKTAPGIEGLPTYNPGPETWVLPREVVTYTPPKAHAIEERIATAVRPPMPSYPRNMAAQGLSGTCEVRFDLTLRGQPFNVVATCSHPGFESGAERAVSQALFLPKIQQGVPVESHNYVYPLEYKLQ